MPLGNGDVALNVWVDNGSGDLIFYVAKSDAFDSNSFQVKVRVCGVGASDSSQGLAVHFRLDVWLSPLTHRCGAAG